MAVASDGLEKLEDMIVRQAEATGAQVAAAKAVRAGHQLGHVIASLTDDETAARLVP